MVIEREIQELSHVSSGHFPDRSARWLLRQREHLEALLKIIASDLSVYLDFDRVEPLNRSFISDELRTQESDMVFSVPFQGQTETCDELIIYILIEHQSTVDPSMGLRLLSYMAQIWAEQRRQQNMEVVNMVESIIELSEQRGLEQGIEQGLEQGIEQGARETSIRNILAVLTARFPQHDPQPVQHALEAILDPDQLTQLLQTAALTPTFEAFLQALDA